MSCLALLLLTAVVIYFGALIAFFVAAGQTALVILTLVLIPLILLFTWKSIYPWLVRIGRWSAQVKNIVFLALLLAAVGVGVGYLVGVPSITVPLIGIQLPITVLVFGLLFLFLLLLGAVVWIVRIWRRGWPLARDFFWDIWFRLVALLWRIVVGVPLGVAWFLYHPPLRWLIAAFIFYLRGVAAATAWLVYNPPLRSIGIAIHFIAKIVGLIVAAILYNPPILWLVQAGLFGLRLIARVISAAIYGIWAWWPTKGIRGTLGTGVTTDSKAYQDYKYA